MFVFLLQHLSVIMIANHYTTKQLNKLNYFYKPRITIYCVLHVKCNVKNHSYKLRMLFKFIYSIIDNFNKYCGVKFGNSIENKN